MEKSGDIFLKFYLQKNKTMAKILEIIKHPNKLLKLKSKKVKIEDIKSPTMIELIENMEKTMMLKNAAGLAAPQIGEGIRLIILYNENKNIIMINPEIVKKSWSKETEMEGCLSVLNKKNEIYYRKVSRHKKIICLYFDENGKKQKIEASGMLSRAIQHEIDHLDGILLIDKIIND